MNKYLIAALAMLGASLLGSASLSPANASAQGFSEFGFAPYGFYQPFGARYSTSIRTPPYFATNPPVYYGARHARPYGMSPFAAPPMVQASPTYQGRLRTEFLEPIVPTPDASFLNPPLGDPCYNPHCDASNEQFETLPDPTAAEPIGAIPPRISPAQVGAIQLNPFVSTDERIASNDRKTEA